MRKQKNPISLFKQTNFSNTIWWQVKINISGYQNETNYSLVTEIFKNRIFRLIYPRIYQNKKKLSRILVQFYEDGYICWIDVDKLHIEKFDMRKSLIESGEILIEEKIPLILNWIRDQSKVKKNYREY